MALLFKNLATLRTDALLFSNIDELAWKGPGPEFATWCNANSGERLLARAAKIKFHSPSPIVP
jgi:hypothetical protein